ncbi:MAG TPA: hypothetical protein VII96_00670 [Acidimicrobiales bacterium]
MTSSKVATLAAAGPLVLAAGCSSSSWSTFPGFTVKVTQAG